LQKVKKLPERLFVSYHKKTGENLNIGDNSQDFFALSSQWCADIIRIVLAAQLKGSFDRRLELTGRSSTLAQPP
jgi:hypothetical protein